MNAYWTTFAAAIAFLGIVLNIMRQPQGFACWIVSNTLWCWHNCVIGEHAQSVLFAAFAVMSIYGLYKWRRRDWLNRDNLAEIITESGQLCRRIIGTAASLESLEPGKKIKVNWMKEKAQKILDMIDGAEP